MFVERCASDVRSVMAFAPIQLVLAARCWTVRRFWKTGLPPSLLLADQFYTEPVSGVYSRSPGIPLKSSPFNVHNAASRTIAQAAIARSI